MAPKYKLTYFNLRGLAEPVRFMLSYMEEDFEDVRIERDNNWAALKPCKYYIKRVSVGYIIQLRAKAKS